MATPADPHHARRYIDLVEELAEELGRGHGWMTAVAGRLGVHRSTLLRVREGSRGVTSTLIERATSSLGLDPAYFAADGGSYRQWLRTQQPEEQHPVVRRRIRRLDEFFGRWEDAADLAEETRAALARKKARARRTGQSDDTSQEETLALLDRLISAVDSIPLITKLEQARGALQNPPPLGLLELITLALAYEVLTMQEIFSIWQEAVREAETTREGDDGGPKG